MKRRLLTLLLALTLFLGLALPVCADTTGLVRDGAELLTDRAERELEEQLERISREYETDVIVVTLSTIRNARLEDYEDEYYDTHFGPEHDGIMLLIVMDLREYRILSNGYGNVAVPPSDIDTICRHIEPYLRDGDYAAAFRTFAEDCEYQLAGQRDGFPFDLGGTLAISLGVGFAVALVVVLILALQLRSTGRRKSAQGYACQGSFRLTGSHDIYLYRNLSRRPRQDSSSGSGRSSGGGGRSSGGGRF